MKHQNLKKQLLLKAKTSHNNDECELLNREQVGYALGGAAVSCCPALQYCGTYCCSYSLCSIKIKDVQ